MDWLGNLVLPQKNQKKRKNVQTKWYSCCDKKVNGSYSWFKYSENGNTKYYLDKIQDIIADNHFNSNPPKKVDGAYDWLNGSYIAFIEEDEFLRNPIKYIDNAYEKSENDGKGYDLTVTED